MNSELILHHYDFSNYSEKVRLVLGLKDLSWRSVEIPSVLPKPDYIPLTGGYRRAPALQIGADIYCDTLRIIEELELRFPEPSVYPGPDAAAQRALMAGLERWTDSVLTRTSINYISSAHADPNRFTPDFKADRAALLGKPEPSAAHRRAAARKNLTQLRPQLAWIGDLLSDGRRYVWGDTMSLADCVVYHPLWIMDQLSNTRIEIIPDRVREWMDRIAACGHGHLQPMTAIEAIQIAADADPIAAPPSEKLDGDPPIGTRVEITPVDYGRENPSLGTLVSIDSMHMTLEHANERTGQLNVHFPRFGYQVRSASD